MMEGTEQQERRCKKKLIDEVTGDPTDEYVDIITQVFNRFDRNKDGILDLREFNCMLHTSGEEPTDKHTYGGLLMMFEEAAGDGSIPPGSRPAGVSLKGFIQMSVLSTVEDPEGERAQLKKLGFDLPREAFPDPPTPDEEADEDDEEKESTDEMLEAIKKIAIRAQEEKEKRKREKALKEEEEAKSAALEANRE